MLSIICVASLVSNAARDDFSQPFNIVRLYAERLMKATTRVPKTMTHNMGESCIRLNTKSRIHMCTASGDALEASERGPDTRQSRRRGKIAMAVHTAGHQSSVQESLFQSALTFQDNGYEHANNHKVASICSSIEQVSTVFLYGTHISRTRHSQRMACFHKKQA